MWSTSTLCRNIDCPGSRATITLFDATHIFYKPPDNIGGCSQCSTNPSITETISRRTEERFTQSEGNRLAAASSSGTNLSLLEVFVAPPHLVLHALEPHLQKETLKVLAVHSSHDVTVTPRITALVRQEMRCNVGILRVSGTLWRELAQRVTHNA